MMAHELRCLLLALQFLTRIPVTGRLAHWVGYSPQLLRASARYFPLVGAGVGVLTACLLYTSPSPRDGATSRMPSSA